MFAFVVTLEKNWETAILEQGIVIVIEACCAYSSVYNTYRLCLVFKNFEEKWEGKKKKGKIKSVKNRLKINKLFFYVSSNPFHLISSLI